MPHTLYMIHGSHPCICAERALQLKGQPYRIVELPPMIHVPAQWLRFRHRTVPALVLGNGEQIVGSRAIVHRLDALVPEPPLLPRDPQQRVRVEEAEQWGDRVLQPAVRRLSWVGLQRSPSAIASYAEGSRLPLPGFVRSLIAPGIIRLEQKLNRASATTARTDFAVLPAQLDLIDGWIAEGVLGGEQPNAADLQIGSSLRLLGTFADARPLLAGRPCWALAQRLFPAFAGNLPAGSLTAA